MDIATHGCKNITRIGKLQLEQGKVDDKTETMIVESEMMKCKHGTLMIGREIEWGMYLLSLVVWNFGMTWTCRGRASVR